MKLKDTFLKSQLEDEAEEFDVDDIDDDEDESISLARWGGATPGNQSKLK